MRWMNSSSDFQVLELDQTRGKINYPLLSTVVSLGLLVAGCAPQVRPDPIPVYEARTFFDTVSTRGASFSHDETCLLISADASGVFNAYSQPVAGGDWQQLTSSSEDAVFGISWFPDDDRFLYTADQGGNERNHVFVRETDGSFKDLTPGGKLKARFLGWSGDRESFWVVSNERDARRLDLYRYATDNYERELVFKNDQGFSLAAISRDQRWIALNKSRSNADSDIYLWDVQDRESPPIHITPHEGDIQHVSRTFSPDGRLLYYLNNGPGEFAQLWSYDLGSKEHKAVVVADWDVNFIVFSETGRYRVTGINQDARTAIRILDTASVQELVFPDLPVGNVSGVSISRSESRMAFYLSSDTAPPNLYILDLSGLQHRQLTDNLNPEIDQEHLVESEVVRYASFDGLEIPSLLFRPHGAGASNRVPALVWVHGGPGGQSRQRYRASLQHLVNHGYAVLAVNNRGSAGYGKTFHHLDDKRHGEVDLRDCVEARKYLEGLNWVDDSRIGIIGASYGGYMVAAALAFEPDVFDIGIDICGVTNWVRTIKSLPPWYDAVRASVYAEMGDPATDEERLRRISPLFHAGNITKPLLVIQGANDPRVPRAESDELVEAAKRNGVPVEYILFPDEGHGLRKRTNRIAASDKFVEFLDLYLKGMSASR